MLLHQFGIVASYLAVNHIITIAHLIDLSSDEHQLGINKFMDYLKHYNLLVETRKKLERKFITGCGYEKHHIVPKSLGGANTKENIVVFTPREHCLAHMILAKMYSGEAKAKMCYALIALAKLRNKNRQALTTKEYDRIRKAHYAALMDPDYRALRSANTAKQWTPERRASVAEKTKQQWQENSKKREFYSSEEWKQRQSKNTARRWQDAEYKQARSDQAKKQWAEGGTLRDR